MGFASLNPSYEAGKRAPGINTRNAVDSPVSQGVYSFPPAHEGTLLEAILRWSSRAVRGGDSPRVETRSRMGKPIWRRGARGRGSHPRTREALGARPRPLRGAAFNGWTGGDEGRRKL